MNAALDMDMVELTTEIVAAYVAHNSLPAGELPGAERARRAGPDLGAL